MQFREADIHDQQLRGLFRYWESKRAGRAFPARSDLDPLEMRAWLGHVFLIEVAAVAGDFRFRLAGSRLVDFFSSELTGVSVDQVRYRGTRPPFREQCVDSVVNRQPAFMIMLMGSDRTRAVYRQLLLPLSADGERINMLLGGAVFAPAAGDRARPGVSGSGTGTRRGGIGQAGSGDLTSP